MFSITKLFSFKFMLIRWVWFFQKAHGSWTTAILMLLADGIFIFGIISNCYI